MPSQFYFGPTLIQLDAPKDTLSFFNFTFENFQHVTPFNKTIRITCIRRIAKTQGLLLPLFSHNRVTSNGIWRYSQSPDGHCLRIPEWSTPNEFVIHYHSENNLDRFLYELIMYIVGVRYEQHGYLRVHALGTKVGEKTYLAVWPSGTGKSPLAHSLLTQTNHMLYGDENVLIKNNSIYPFALPIALPYPTDQAQLTRQFGKPKWLIRIPDSRIATPSPLTHVVPPFSKLSFVFGLGLFQMKEYLLRPAHLMFLLHLFFKRLVALSRIQKCLDSSLNKNSLIE